MKQSNFHWVLVFGLLGVMPLQATLGKTHFILTNPTSVAPDIITVPPEQVSSPPLLPPSTPSAAYQIFFAPQDNVRSHLIKLIDQERQAIAIAAYIMNDAEIAAALSRACKRSVVVELVIDAGCLKDRSSKINQLSASGCTIYIYNPVSSPKGVSLMHNKFALFTNSTHGPHTWTGSYNFTKAANDRNQENVVIFSDRYAFEKFFNQFRRLKAQSYLYTRDKITGSL